MRYKALPVSVRSSERSQLSSGSRDAPHRDASPGAKRVRDFISLLVMLALLPALGIPVLRTLAADASLSASGPVQPGGQVTITGSNFEQNAKMLLTWDAAIAWPARSDNRGNVLAQITVPADTALGQHEVTAAYVPRGGQSNKKPMRLVGVVASVTVTVVLPAATTAPSPVPGTGSPEPSSPVPTASSTIAPSPSAVPTTSPTASESPPPPVSATDFVVATDGNDEAPGTLARPWRTLQKAATTAPAGSTIFIRGGTYAGFVMTRSGLAGAPITFTPYSPESVVVTGTSSTINVIRLVNVHDVVIRGLVVQGAAADRSGSGIRVDSGSFRVTIANNVLRENRSYGVSVADSTFVTVRGNEITGNAEGVYVHHAGEGVLVADNDIHHQDRMVVATVGGNDDHGAVGIAFVRTTGRVTATGNRIWGNRAFSPDYGYDGGAFEIYAASNVVITGNQAWDNRNVIETGSDGAACQNNVFTRNILHGATAGNVTKGMVLRCAENMLVANNTFFRLDEFVFDLLAGGTYATSNNGLRIINNMAVMANGKVYGVNPNVLGKITVDYNLVWNESGGTIGSVDGTGATSNWATFRSWTGFDFHGVNSSPGFIDASSLDFHLAADSAGVDRATTLWGITDDYIGLAPDIGRYESH